jgi:hypothetical protein
MQVAIESGAMLFDAVLLKTLIAMGAGGWLDLRG